ncbi:MAG TPA: hypothetical protein VN924_31400 [Bryobacteraceae bacterium]|jgi:hypothetical protein|nr:hypothetical protein [Bryobacteraceae bacterium]
MLDNATARKYTAAWARKVGANPRDLQEAPPADFFGRLGSLGFDYSAAQKRLAVRAYLFPYSASFTSGHDLLPWLNGIGSQHPDWVSSGVFETCTPRWEPDKEPSLFLRVDLHDGSQGDSAVIARLLKLREDAMLWRRVKLTEALDSLVRHERQEKGQ